MRNLILMAVAAVAFFVVGIANPKVLIAQDRPDRGEGVQARQETFRNRAENLSDRRENRRVAKKDFQRYPEYRGDHRRDFRGHREFRRDQKRDFQAQAWHSRGPQTQLFFKAGSQEPALCQASPVCIFHPIVQRKRLEHSSQTLGFVWSTKKTAATE